MVKEQKNQCCQTTQLHWHGVNNMKCGELYWGQHSRSCFSCHYLLDLRGVSFSDVIVFVFFRQNKRHLPLLVFLLCHLRLKAIHLVNIMFCYLDNISAPHKIILCANDLLSLLVWFYKVRFMQIKRIKAFRNNDLLSYDQLWYVVLLTGNDHVPFIINCVFHYRLHLLFFILQMIGYNLGLAA